MSMIYNSILLRFPLHNSFDPGGRKFACSLGSSRRWVQENVKKAVMNAFHFPAEQKVFCADFVLNACRLVMLPLQDVRECFDGLYSVLSLCICSDRMHLESV